VTTELERLKRIIDGARRVLLTSHENPDGDALGSMLALGLAVESLGKEVVFFNKDGVPAALEFLPHASRVLTDLSPRLGPFDATFVLDCTDLGRVGIGLEGTMAEGWLGRTVIIDHHQTRKPSADLHVLDPEAAATGEIVYDLLRRISVDIGSDIATCLYVAVTTDTGTFRYSNTTSRVLRIAADLVDRGASPYEVAEAVYESQPLEKLRLLALALSTLETACGGLVASIVVDRAMFTSTSTDRTHTEGFVNVPRTVRGVEVAVMFREDEPDLWKVSLRSKRRLDVARLAERFGGGGHERAAGCMLRGAIEAVKRTLYAAIEEALEWKG